MNYIPSLLLVVSFLSNASIVEFTLSCAGRKGDLLIDVADYGLATELWGNNFEVGVRMYDSKPKDKMTMYLFNNGDFVYNKISTNQWIASWSQNKPKKIRECILLNKKNIHAMELKKIS